MRDRLKQKKGTSLTPAKGATASVPSSSAASRSRISVGISPPRRGWKSTTLASVPPMSIERVSLKRINRRDMGKVGCDM